MREVSDEDINRRIAEFMKWVKPKGFNQYYELPKDFVLDKNPNTIPSQYGRGIPTKSLDSLIPVVEKLGSDIYLQYFIRVKKWSAWYVDTGRKEIEDKSPSRALSLAIFNVLGER